MQEREPYEGDGLPRANPSLTRRALCTKAEDLAVELVRWKVWRVEGHAYENLQEAQAMQALVMGLIELLDDVQGSPTATRTELARAVPLLGETLPALGAVITSEIQRVRAAEHREDAAFLRAHGIRLGDADSTNEPFPKHAISYPAPSYASALTMRATREMGCPLASICRVLNQPKGVR
jgi:hypothetical protein